MPIQKCDVAQAGACMTIKVGDSEPVVLEGVEVWIAACVACLAVGYLGEIATRLVHVGARRLRAAWRRSTWYRSGSLGRAAKK